MTQRQKLMKLIYPLLVKAGKWLGMKAGILENKNKTNPSVSIYTLSILDNSGQRINFSQYEGKKLLLVNTASDCGYTPQLAELQKLQDLYREKIMVIGFPSNDFKEQEMAADRDIAAFCSINYNVQFPLMAKSIVLKKQGQNPVFEWLATQSLNGWNNHEPGWNFTKYLVNENGILTHIFDSGISPSDSRIKESIAG